MGKESERSRSSKNLAAAVGAGSFSGHQPCRHAVGTHDMSTWQLDGSIGGRDCPVFAETDWAAFLRDIRTQLLPLHTWERFYEGPNRAAVDSIWVHRPVAGVHNNRHGQLPSMPGDIRKNSVNRGEGWDSRTRHDFANVGNCCLEVLTASRGFLVPEIRKRLDAYRVAGGDFVVWLAR